MSKKREGLRVIVYCGFCGGHYLIIKLIIPVFWNHSVTQTKKEMQIHETGWKWREWIKKEANRMELTCERIPWAVQWNREQMEYHDEKQWNKEKKQRQWNEKYEQWKRDWLCPTTSPTHCHNTPSSDWTSGLLFILFLTQILLDCVTISDWDLPYGCEWELVLLQRWQVFAWQSVSALNVGWLFIH